MSGVNSMGHFSMQLRRDLGLHSRSLWLKSRQHKAQRLLRNLVGQACGAVGFHQIVSLFSSPSKCIVIDGNPPIQVDSEAPSILSKKNIESGIPFVRPGFAKLRNLDDRSCQVGSEEREINIRIFGELRTRARKPVQFPGADIAIVENLRLSPAPQAYLFVGIVEQESYCGST